jgi:secreted trypsin-like serine protease
MGKKFIEVLVFVVFVVRLARSECGISSANGNVVGGEPLKSYPWSVVLSYATDGSEFFCGGNLVSSQHVLSGDAIT